MLLRMGCKRWTRGTQLGLRIYTDTIRRLDSSLERPSSDGRWDSLHDFIEAVKHGQVRPYTRRILVVSRGKPGIKGTMTIAKHGRTTQGYITAPHNTWFYGYVERNMGENHHLEFTGGRNTDLLVIPKQKDIKAELNKDEQKIHRKVAKHCKERNWKPPRKAQEIGLFYEIMEKEYLEERGLIAQHRYPSSWSKDARLAKRAVSCDIDVFDGTGAFLKFVEVKSLSAVPGTEFPLTVREYESRKKCARRRWPYEIVVYYHIGSNVLERQVIDADQKLTAVPSGYMCCTRGEG